MQLFQFSLKVPQATANNLLKVRAGLIFNINPYPLCLSLDPGDDLSVAQLLEMDRSAQFSAFAVESSFEVRIR
jgi:hypothetical protein